MTTYLNSLCFVNFMANRMQLLDARLQRVDARTQTIFEASAAQRAVVQLAEEWWPSLVQMFGTEDAMFQRLGIDRMLFDEALALVRDVAAPHRGRRARIRTNRERLLCLMVFLSKGIDTLEVLLTTVISTRSHIVETVKNIAQLFYNNLVDGAVGYNCEVDEVVPEASLVVDCTVCEIHRPKRPFDAAKVFFSGKHYIYALKKEVMVNIRSGTAAVISKAYPGSVHDIIILREHAGAVNRLLGRRSLLADLGYRGAERDVPTTIVCGQGQRRLSAKRVIVECYFGRLKLLWSVFTTTWKMSEDSFDVFFDIACALTNLDIYHRPLRANDQAFNQGVMNAIRDRLAENAERRRDLNAEYRQRRRDRLGVGPLDGFL